MHEHATGLALVISQLEKYLARALRAARKGDWQTCDTQLTLAVAILRKEVSR